MTEDQIKYVVGFLFDDTLEYVTLIRKLRPKWMEGRYNGPGGKIEEGETPEIAMRREFEEECGGFTFSNWVRFATLKDLRGYGIEFLYGVEHANKVGALRVMLENLPHEEDVEEASVFHISEIGDDDMLPNLSWLIPLAITIIRGTESVSHFTFTEDTPNTIRLQGRCEARESGGVRCELPLGHEGNHACPKALAAFLGGRVEWPSEGAPAVQSYDIKSAYPKDDDGET